MSLKLIALFDISLGYLGLIACEPKKSFSDCSLREDMFDLAKPGVGMEDKLVLLSRLKGMYDCLLPSPSGVLPRL